MRKLLFLGMSTLFVFAACNKEEQINFQVQDPQLLTSESYYVSDTVMLRFYETYFQDTFGTIDTEYEFYINQENDTIHYYRTYNQSILTGTLTSWQYRGHARNGYFVDLRNLTIEDSSITGGYAYVHLLNGEKLGHYYFDLEGEFQVELLSEGINEPIGESQFKMNGWLECTVNCYNDSKASCNSDPECKTMCDFANLAGVVMGFGMACNESIVLACGGLCSRNNYAGGGLPIIFANAKLEIEEMYPNGVVF